MAELFLSRRAKAELREIWRYIAAENPGGGKHRLLFKIDAKLQILRDFPNIGALRDEIQRRFRMLVEGNYLLLYQYDEDNERLLS